MFATERSYMQNINVDDELHELQGHFPDLTRGDFYKLDTGNIGVVIEVTTSGEYDMGTFEVILEFTPSYPDQPPNAWITQPTDLDMDCGHIYYQENGQSNICITAAGDWDSSYTSWDAMAMVKSWIYGYCQWHHTGEWGWKEASTIDYMLNT